MCLGGRRALVVAGTQRKHPNARCEVEAAAREDAFAAETEDSPSPRRFKVSQDGEQLGGRGRDRGPPDCMHMYSLELTASEI